MLGFGNVSRTELSDIRRVEGAGFRTFWSRDIVLVDDDAGETVRIGLTSEDPLALCVSDQERDEQAEAELDLEMAQAHLDHPTLTASERNQGMGRSI